MLRHIVLAYHVDEMNRMLREISVRPRLDRKQQGSRGRLGRAVATLLDRHAVAVAAPGTGVTIRRARPADTPSLGDLAAMSDRRPPSGPVLVAVVESQIVAALPIGGGPAVADIRRPTADIVQLLELRSKQMRRGGQAVQAA